MKIRQPPGKSELRRWVYWTFIAANVAGIILMVPLIRAVSPLVQIWWNTRSIENFTKSQRPSASAVLVKRADANALAEPAQTLDSSLEESLKKLTNGLSAMNHLSSAELDQIVTGQFGPKKTNEITAGEFDRDSAVFHAIRRSVISLQGRQLYCYEIDLIDQNGRHKSETDCFLGPDLEYERSMATLKLIDQNPQLKKIYAAFAHVLAERSATNVPLTSPQEKPVVRFEKRN